MRQETQVTRRAKAALASKAKAKKAAKLKTIDLKIGMSGRKTKSASARITKRSGVKAKGKNVKTMAPAKGAKKVAASKKAVGRSKKTTARPVTNKAGKQATQKSAQKSAKIAADLNRKIALVRADKKRQAILAKQRKEKAKALPEQNGEETLPIYLTTPTKEMLRVFRAARRRQSKLLSNKKGVGRGFIAKQDKSFKKYVLDLHVHTQVTSGYLATGGVEPSQALVRLARAKGIDLLAITDLYSGESIDQVKEMAQNTTLVIFPGFEIVCTLAGCADLPFLCLFPEYYGTEEISRVLRLMDVPREANGRSSYVMPNDFASIVATVERHGGIMIPSHVDKTPSRQQAISTLVDEYGFHLFDIIFEDNVDLFKERWPNGGFTFLSFSNANSLAQVGTKTSKLRLAEPTFEALQKIARRREPSIDVM